MTGPYAYSPGIWPPLLAAVFLAALSLYAWRRRHVPGAVPLAIGSQFALAWLVSIAMQAAAVDDGTKLAWFRFGTAVKLPAVSCTLCFVVEYVYPGRWLNRRNLSLLAVPSLAAVAMVGLAPELMWRRLEVAADGTIVAQMGAAGQAGNAWGLGLIVVNVTALVWLFVRSPHHRGPAALMVLGAVGARAIYLAGFVSPTSRAPLQSDVVPLLFTWGAYAIALFGFRILDPLPMARIAALQQMQEGMVVLDLAWCVADINPAAARLLETSVGQARGQPLTQLLPELADPGLGDTLPLPGVRQVSLVTVPAARQCALDLSLLKDFRGTPIARLLLLRDVTEERRAQSRLLEQRWAQATLEERAQLAQELHDGLSQNLAFLNLQAQATQLYLQTGQPEAAETSLERLAEASREMQGDIRELIGNLLSVTLPSAGLLTTLRQIVSQYQQSTGLVVELDAGGLDGPADEAGVVPPAVAVQLLRIVQEALANVRKHAEGATQVIIELRVDAVEMHLAVTDDGAGFDPSAARIDGRHYGLEVMRQRAARVGGEMAVDSAQGQGTRLRVRVPLAGSEGSSGHEDLTG